MVTRSGAASLMHLIKDLTYIHERCRSVAMMPTQAVRVKGENYILSILKREYPLVEAIADKVPAVGPAKNGMNEWIIYLDKKYPEQFVLFGAQITLDVGDARKLGKEVASWIDSLLNAYKETGLVVLKEESVGELFSPELLDVLDGPAKDDLADGASAILHLMPTPGAMILFRVTEHIVRSLYAKVMGKNPSGNSWASLLSELEASGKLDKPLLGYLDYLREKRNEAEHPDKRFSQEESERILLQVKGLLEEVRSFKVGNS